MRALRPPPGYWRHPDVDFHIAEDEPVLSLNGPISWHGGTTSTGKIALEIGDHEVDAAAVIVATPTALADLAAQLAAAVTTHHAEQAIR